MKIVKHCRLCAYPKLSLFLDLGHTPPSDQFISKDKLEGPIVHYPLKVLRCDHCYFVQLSYVVAPEVLYQEDYPYESSTTKTGREHFNNFANYVSQNYNLSKNDLVIDIGSNVGVLLSAFKKNGVNVLGIDPAHNIAQIAEKNGIPTIAKFFGEGISQEILKKYQKAKVITGTNVFAHIDNLQGLMKEVDSLLTDDGIFVIEAPYLVHLLEQLEYDTIYHEHLSYLSLIPLSSFFQKIGFELFDVQQTDIHGGSIRLYVSRKGRYSVSEKVFDLIKHEKDNNIHSIENLKNFAKAVEKNRNDLVTLIRQLKKEGKKIAAVSAPAKGMTLLNYCGLGKEILEFITEVSVLKIDRYAPGTHLKIVEDSALISEDIDYALLLAWNFKDEIMKNLSLFKQKGGKFIIPIPSPEIM